MIIFYAVLLLGILIFVHELGHFLVAKVLGVKVLRFSLGFGSKVIGKTFGETEYRISALPLGGYVKMLGEEPGEEPQESEKHRAYKQQPVWKRFLIVSAGPLFNICFAGFVFFFIFLNGVPYMLPEVGEVKAGSPAAMKGLLKGDNIIEINGTPIDGWNDMTSIIHNSPGKEIRIKIKRSSTTFDIDITPERQVMKDIFGESKEIGLIGIAPSGRTSVREEDFSGALSSALKSTWDWCVLIVVAIVKLIQRVIPAETIGGPILIFQVAGQQAEQGALNFFMFMAIISINLGILNLLPIPILDGGHLLFLSIEAVRGKPLSEKIIISAQKIGLVLILTLMAFAFYNDIMRLITGKMIP